MAVQELRQHLRVTSKSRATLTLWDGGQIRCEVRDLSLGGAYLVRMIEFEAKRPPDVAELCEIHIFHPGLGDGFTTQALIVRIEDGGPGIALKFVLSEDESEAVVEHVRQEAREQRISPTSLGIPVIERRESHLHRARRLAKPVVWVSLVVSCVFAFLVVRSWLGAMLSS